MNDISNIDVSTRTIGDIVPIICQVETCLSDAIVSIYKGDQVVFTSQATEPFINSVVFTYNHQVTADSAGQYACRGFSTQGSTPLHYFNITGEFLHFLFIGIDASYMYVCILLYHTFIYICMCDSSQ